ncbi:MAG: SDR family oxidoreductase [Saprospiraceae bacterium]|nr:SDR family oxidoreductase [Saprospiraceae bacterium]
MKKFLIVGGASGIGAALVRRLHVDHKILATHHQSAPLELPGVQYQKVDVTQSEWGFELGAEPLHGVVYCPGTINLRPFNRIKPKDFLLDYDLQVVGAVRSFQKVLPHLEDGASLILFSTVAVQRGYPYHAQVAASKGAIEGLTKALAAEFAPRYRVNCIAPSLTDTPLANKLLNTEEKRTKNAQRHPLQRIGVPEDLASMAAYLLSEEASWITGQIFHVDGGISSI